MLTDDAGAGAGDELAGAGAGGSGLADPSAMAPPSVLTLSDRERGGEGPRRAAEQTRAPRPEETHAPDKYQVVLDKWFNIHELID